MAGIREDRRGSVSMIAAGIMIAGVCGLSFAADLGSVYLAGRRLQGIADAAALSAAANIAAPLDAAKATVADNGWSGRAATSVASGSWTAFAPPDNRFTAGGTDPDAVRVVLATDAPLVFGRIFGRPTIRVTRRAIAARRAMASFSLGSRLLSVDAGIANALLTALANNNRVTLTAADYNALASADVDLFAFASTLRTQARVATFNDALSLTTTPAQALSAAADTLAASDTAAAGALRKLAASVGTLPAVPLSSLLSLGTMGAQDHAAAVGGSTVGINALGFARALLETSGGARQVTLNLSAGIPGLAGVAARYATGARPAGSAWLTLTAKDNAIVATSQSRLLIDAAAGTIPTSQGPAEVHLPIYVELAEAKARLSSLTCTRARREARVQVQPAIGHASIAGLPDPSASFANHARPQTETDASLVTAVGLVSVAGKSRTDFSNGDWQTATFGTSDIAGAATRTVSSQGIVGGVAASLVSKLSLTVQIGPLKLPDLSLGKMIGSTLATAAPAVDGLLASLTGLLGVGLGQADVRINGVRCGVPALVA